MWLSFRQEDTKTICLYTGARATNQLGIMKPGKLRELRAFLISHPRTSQTPCCFLAWCSGVLMRHLRSPKEELWHHQQTSCTQHLPGTSLPLLCFEASCLRSMLLLVYLCSRLWESSSTSFIRIDSGDKQSCQKGRSGCSSYSWNRESRCLARMGTGRKRLYHGLFSFQPSQRLLPCLRLRGLKLTAVQHSLRLIYSQLP